MSDALADAEDINSAIKDGNIGLGSAQEEEVESELAEMIREAEKIEGEEKARKEGEEKARKEKVREDEATAALAESTVPTTALPEKKEEEKVEEKKNKVLA